MVSYRSPIPALPTLWLLGKTGSGKTSLIRFLTGNAEAQIGSGFRPCTATAQLYEFPEHEPWLRFLDTRGLGEPGYDPADDLAICAAQSHALLLCVRLDDPEQSSLLSALKKIKKSSSINKLLVLHTAKNQIHDAQGQRTAQAYQQHQIEQIWGKPIPQVQLELADPADPEGGDELLQHLVQLLPDAAQLSQKHQHKLAEQQLFLQHQKRIRRYATIAAATDTLPAVGLISVPALQAAMLKQLASAYQLQWRRRDLSAFVGTLGAGLGIQYASHLGLRQLVKLLPVYGPTLGSASAAAISFATTYAIGRVACQYLYYQQQEQPLSPEALQQLYRQALTRIHAEKAHETTHSTTPQ